MKLRFIAPKGQRLVKPPQMAALAVFLLMLLAVSSIGAGAVRHGSPSPLTQAQVLGLLQGGVANERIQTLVEERGIAFTPSPGDLNDLRRAGAAQPLLDAIREAAPSPRVAVSRSEPRGQNIQPAARRPALAARPGSVAGASAGEGGGEFFTGNELFHEGRWAEAAREYKIALQHNPNDITARTNLALALSRDGLVREAITQFRIVLRGAPALAEAHNGLGVAYRKQHNLAAAVREFRTALRYNPNDARAHNNLAVALQGEGRLSQAVAEYYKSLGLDPNCCNARYNLGTALEQEGDSRDAVAAFRAVVKAQPRNARAHFALASALESNRDYAAALDEYRIAAQLAPADNAIHKSYTALLDRLNAGGLSPRPN